MSIESKESNEMYLGNLLVNPEEEAIPAMENYLKSYAEMTKDDLYSSQQGIVESSFLADWASYIKINPRRVEMYLDMSFEAIKTSDSSICRHYLYQPLIVVLTRIERIDEGKEIFQKSLTKAQEFCEKIPGHKNFAEYLLYRMEYQRWVENRLFI